MGTERDELPSGYVTFVFTDIEGSTPLLKRLGDQYAEVGERHDELLLAAFTEHGGRVVHTAGDSMFVAFANTTAAVRGCCAAQVGIAAEQWPPGEQLKVRMGLHVGLGKPRNGDYVAMAVNQAARVMSAAHGGQILMTDAVVGRLEDESLSGSIVPIGRYRLRDFDDPPALHQHVDWAVFGEHPVRATPTKGHNLKVPATTFFDRQREFEEIRRWLTPGSVVSLIGPGGVGKSRLATEAGAAHAADWPDGVWAADLADLADDGLVVERLADVVAAGTRESIDRIDDVIERLRARRSVLIYDGYEHHIEACAGLIGAIQRECPGIAQLATGREPLRIPGEHRIMMSPLPLAVDGGDLEEIRDADSTRLFLDRALTVRPDLVVDESTLRAVDEICRHLDGLPLAIEIAAARVDVMSVDEIVDALDDQFRLLRTRDRAIPERQRTMHALLDWSTQLLVTEEQIVLRRLAIFTGRFRLEAAEVAIGSDDVPTDDVQELVWSLVDKSLVVADTTRRPTTYRLLETVQQYGRRLLRDHDEELVIASRIARWFDGEIGPDRIVDQRWINTMHVAQSNVRTVLSLVAEPNPELAQRMACSLGRYHEAVQSFRPGIEELSRYVDQLAATTRTRVALLMALAGLHLRTADVERAARLADEAAGIQEQVGAPTWDDVGLERTRGDIAVRTGATDDAASIASDTLRRGVSPTGQARMWNLLGVARFSQRDYPQALVAFEHELTIYAELGIEGNMASAHGNVAEVAFQIGDLALAAHHQSQCLDLALTLALAQPVMLAYSSVMAAQLASQGDWFTAVVLQSSADAALAEIGHRFYDFDDPTSATLLSAAAHELGQDVVTQARSVGLELDSFQAADTAERVFASLRERASN